MPIGICRIVGGLAVAEAGDVDGGDHLALRGRQLMDLRQDLARVEDLDRLGGGGRDEARVLGLERRERGAAVTGAQAGDVGVAQRLVQVGAGAGGPDAARAGEDPYECVLDQILGVVMGAGEAAGGTTQRVEVDRKRFGIQFLAHRNEAPDFGLLLISGNSP